jgi:hypothetical protein
MISVLKMKAGFNAKNFKQEGFHLSFEIKSKI